jgi:uncharacterized protein
VSVIKRNLILPKTGSFFLFGARGTGKSTLLKHTKHLSDALWLNFLDPDTEEEYSVNPSLLEKQANALKAESWIVLDEVQKIPKLLNTAQKLIVEKKIKFALTGSSSRKLKAGGANLLGGRAFVFSLYPFTFRELESSFHLNEVLQWGTLPIVWQAGDDKDKARYLRSYLQTYLKEEVLQEQLVKNLDPFRMFLPIAAQMDGKIINYSHIAKDTGVDFKTIQNYYQILVDTYLGFYLETHQTSYRKVQIQAPKFYLFDNGVKRALQNRLNLPLEDQGQEYGEAFESWFINECHRLNHYNESDFTFSYLRTKDDAEIDLIVERPGAKTVYLEIKSSMKIDEKSIRHLLNFSRDIKSGEFVCASRVKQAQKIEKVWILPWKEAFKVLGF